MPPLKGVYMKKEIKTDKAPAAIGPYSQAIEANGTLYVSGQLPIDATTGEFAGDTIESQTKQSLSNVKYILEEAGYTFDNVVKCSVFLKNIEDFAGMNGVYNEFFGKPYPARAAYAVKTLPKDALVEIEVIAVK